MAPALDLPNGTNNTNGHTSPPPSPSSSPRTTTITILVTGFGPFLDKFPINPSFEITKSLPDSLSLSSSSNTSINIIRYPHPIRVSYEDVRLLLPKLHASYDGTVDLVLHIGMASGRKWYCAERYGRRDGYVRNKDLDNQTPPPSQSKTLFPDCPEIMSTSLPFSALMRAWQHNLSLLPPTSPGFEADIRPSEDAGRYLCDWTYFNSLAWFGRRSGCLEGGKGGKVRARPVMFLHVPAESSGDMIVKGREVCEGLIRGMVEVFLDEEGGEQDRGKLE